MRFNINVHVDETTWPHNRITEPRLVRFRRGWHAAQIDYLAMLHTLGILTTPVPSSGYSLAEYWAQVRYLHAVDFAQPWLLLTNTYAELDAHQKTILSDDFGMGLSICWLEATLGLDLGQFCDGAYFIKNMAGRFGARVAPKTNKRGPRKSPDFVVPDANGQWHVIECKGTQSGSQSRRDQIATFHADGSLKSGGRVQKTTISFPAAHAGQRLAAGVKIALSGSGEVTDLWIADPSEEPILKLDVDDMRYAFDPVYRNVSSKALALVGATQSGAQVASPAGIIQEPLETSWSQRDSFVKSRAQRAKAEYDELKIRAKTRDGGTPELTRELNAELAQPIEWGGRTYRQVDVRYRCDVELLERAQDEAESVEPIEQGDDFWSQTATKAKFESDLPERDGVAPKEATSIMRLGSVFSAELILS